MNDFLLIQLGKYYYIKTLNMQKDNN